MVTSAAGPPVTSRKAYYPDSGQLYSWVALACMKISWAERRCLSFQLLCEVRRAWLVATARWLRFSCAALRAAAIRAYIGVLLPYLSKSLPVKYPFWITLILYVGVDVVPATVAPFHASFDSQVGVGCLLCSWLPSDLHC